MIPRIIRHCDRSGQWEVSFGRKFLAGSLHEYWGAGDPKGSPPERTSARTFAAGDPKGSLPKRTSATVERAGAP